MSDWNPGLYSRFEEERTRAAMELLARVPLERARHVVDLGCGPGNSTELLARRFPAARVVGTDTSEAMLARARQRVPSCEFDYSDIALWSPAEPVDLVFANACLQWVPAHDRLIPRLLSALNPGGVLAIQVPDNLDEPSHRLMREVAALPAFSAVTGDAGKARCRILSAQQYYDIVAPVAAADIWRTTYYHRLEGAGTIVQWLRSSGLRPFIDALPADRRPAYLAEYERRIEAAYPQRTDGKRLLAFPRLFIVAQRPSSTAMGH